MASASDTYDILIKLRDLGATTNLNKLEGSLKKVEGSVFNLKNAFAALGAGVAISNITSTFANFDDSIRQAAAVTKSTAQEMQNMSAAAQEMGATTQFSARQAGEGLVNLGRAGFDAEQSIASLPSVLQLAAAGVTDMGTAADISTNIMSAYGKTSDELATTNDVLVSTFTSTNSTIEELGTAFSYVGPIAKGVGANFENLVGTLGQLHNAGIKGSTAGTTLRGVLDALFNPTKQEADMMGILSDRIGGVGLQLKDSSGDFVGFTELVEQLEEAGITAEEALKLFGQRAGPGMAALLNQGSEQLALMDQQLASAGGTAERVQKQMESGLGGAIRSLGSAWEGLKISLGEGLESSLGNIIQYLKGQIQGLSDAITQFKSDGTFDEWSARVTDAFKRSIEVLKGFVGAIYAALDALSPLIARLLDLSPIFVGLVVSAIGLSKAITAVNAVMAVTSTTVGKKLVDSLIASVSQMEITKKSINALKAATKSLSSAIAFSSGALKSLGAVGAAAFVGWQVGRLIGEFKLFEDGTVSLNEKIQQLFSRWDESVDKNISKFQELQSKYEEFKDFRLPDDFASAPVSAMEELKKQLAEARAYWTAVQAEQKTALDDIIQKYGETSGKVAEYRDQLEQTQSRLLEIETDIKRINTIQPDETSFDFSPQQKAFLQHIEFLKNNSTDGYEEITQVFGEEATKRIQMADEESQSLLQVEEQRKEGTIAILEEQLNEGLITREAYEQEVQRVVEDSSNRQAEILINTEKAYLAAVKQERKKSLAELAQQYELAANERKAIMEREIAEIETLEIQRLNSSTELEQRRIDILEKYSSESVNLQSRLNSQLESLYLEDVETKLNAAEQKFSLVEENINKEIEANEKILEAAKKAYEEQVKAKIEAGEELNKVEEEIQKTFEESVKRQQELQTELVNFRRDKSQEIVGLQQEIEAARVAAVEEAHSRVVELLNQETQSRKVNLDYQIADIENAEARGVITHQEAINQKQDAELSFSQFKIQAAIEAVNAAIDAYGRESDEYKNAVNARIQAETEYLNIKNSVIEKEKDVGEVAKKSSEETSTSRKKATIQIRKTSEELEDAIKQYNALRSAMHVPVSFFTEYDAAINTLSDLNDMIDLTSAAIGQHTTLMGEGMQQAMGQFLDRQKEALEQYKALGLEAAEAGLRIDMTNLTLEEAAQAVEERTEAWRTFKETIAEIQTSYQDLTASALDYSDTTNSSLDSLRENYNIAVESIGNMGDKIQEINNLIADGAMEEATVLSDALIGSYEDIYDAAADYISQLKSEWQEYGDRVLEIQNQILEINQTTEERLRELRRDTMSELEVFNDRRLEYDQLYSEANRELMQGNYDRAVELFEKAADVAEDLATEVENKNGDVVKSLEENTSLSIELIQQAAEAAVAALNKQQDGLKNQQKDTQNSINQTVDSIYSIQSAINDAFSDTDVNLNIDFTGTGSTKRPLSEKITEIKERLEDFKGGIDGDFSELNVDMKGDAGDGKKPLSNVFKRIKDGAKEFIDVVKNKVKLEVDTRAAETNIKKLGNEVKKITGSSGSLSLGGTAGFSFAGGGKVPGRDLGYDSTLAAVRPEEWIIRPESVKFWERMGGDNFFDGINDPMSAVGKRLQDIMVGGLSGMRLPSFATGGQVGGGSSGGASIESFGTINLQVGQTTVAATAPTSQIKALTKHIRREQLLRG